MEQTITKGTLAEDRSGPPKFTFYKKKTQATEDALSLRYNGTFEQNTITTLYFWEGHKEDTVAQLSNRSLGFSWRYKDTSPWHMQQQWLTFYNHNKINLLAKYGANIYCSSYLYKLRGLLIRYSDQSSNNS